MNTKMSKYLQFIRGLDLFNPGNAIFIYKNTRCQLTEETKIHEHTFLNHFTAASNVAKLIKSLTNFHASKVWAAHTGFFKGTNNLYLIKR